MIVTELHSTARAAELLKLCAGPRFMLGSSYLCSLSIPHSSSCSLSSSIKRGTFVRLLPQTISVRTTDLLPRAKPGPLPFAAHANLRLQLQPHLRLDIKQ